MVVPWAPHLQSNNHSLTNQLAPLRRSWWSALRGTSKIQSCTWCAKSVAVLLQAFARKENSATHRIGVPRSFTRTRSDLRAHTMNFLQRDAPEESQ